MLFSQGQELSTQTSTYLFEEGGGGESICSCQCFQELYLETRHGNISINSDLRWLKSVFKGQYLPSLSINYVDAISKDVEKLPPQLSCHCNLDHNNFNHYLIQLWWQFFQIFVNGDIVFAQTWEVLTLKNPIEPP